MNFSWRKQANGSEGGSIPIVDHMHSALDG
jgi:hypothetical protein